MRAVAAFRIQKQLIDREASPTPLSTRFNAAAQNRRTGKLLIQNSICRAVNALYAINSGTAAPPSLAPGVVFHKGARTPGISRVKSRIVGDNQQCFASLHVAFCHALLVQNSSRGVKRIWSGEENRSLFVSIVEKQRYFTPIFVSKREKAG